MKRARFQASLDAQQLARFQSALGDGLLFGIVGISLRVTPLAQHDPAQDAAVCGCCSALSCSKEELRRVGYPEVDRGEPQEVMWCAGMQMVMLATAAACAHQSGVAELLFGRCPAMSDVGALSLLRPWAVLEPLRVVGACKAGLPTSLDCKAACLPMCAPLCGASLLCVHVHRVPLWCVAHVERAEFVLRGGARCECFCRVLGRGRERGAAGGGRDAAGGALPCRQRRAGGRARGTAAQGRAEPGRGLWGRRLFCGCAPARPAGAVRCSATS